MSASFQPHSSRCFVFNYYQRPCTRLRLILEKKILKAVAHDLVVLRIYQSSRLLKKTSLLRVRKPVVTLCRLLHSSLCAYLPTVTHFSRHFNVIDEVLTNRRPAKTRSISLAAPLNPTHTATYLSMNTDQQIWSQRSIEDDEKDMVRLNTLDVMRDSMKFISQAR